MGLKKTYSMHYEENAIVNATAEDIFAYADDHTHFSSHMNKSSWIMGGGKMETQVDEGRGQKVGSHIRMSGTAFGIQLFLDEVIVKREPPHSKAWKTVGDINLVVIDQYELGFEIIPRDEISEIRVYIDYDLPKSRKTRLVGKVFGSMYAKWCVGQMVTSVKRHFNKV